MVRHARRSTELRALGDQAGSWRPAWPFRPELRFLIAMEADPDSMRHRVPYCRTDGREQCGHVGGARAAAQPAVRIGDRLRRGERMVRCVVVLRQLNSAAVVGGQRCMVMMAGRVRRQMACDVQRALQDQCDRCHERYTRGDPLNKGMVAASHPIAVPGLCAIQDLCPGHIFVQRRCGEMRTSSPVTLPPSPESVA